MEQGWEARTGFAASYLRLCRGQGKRLCSSLAPRPGDWLLGPDGPELVGESPRPLATGEVVVPRLDRVVELLREEAASAVVSYEAGDFACLAFDEHGRSLANVVSKTPEEAALRALLFIQAERAANAPGR